MRRWPVLVVAIVGIAMLGPALGVFGGADEAEAQGLLPPRRKPKKKRVKKKPVPPVLAPVPEPVPDPEGEEPGTGMGTGSGTTEAEAEAETGAEAAAEAEAGTEAGTEAGAEGGAVRIDDELDDVGAEVVISEGEVEAARTETGGSRKLETVALAYARMGFDLVRDPAPEPRMGIKAVPEDVLTFRFHGRAEGVGRFGRRSKIKVAGRLDAEVGINLGDVIGVERYEAAVWDTYADIYWSAVDVRAGNQIVAWGFADLLSPNDVVNARDLRRGPLQPLEEARLPVLAVKTKAYSGPFAIEGIVVPVAPANRFDLIEGDFALLGRNAPTRNERIVGAIVNTLADDAMFGPAISPIVDIGQRPDHGLETVELGVRAAITTRHVDLAGVFLWGHERNPRIQVAPELAQVLTETPPQDLTPEKIGQTISMLSMMGKAAVETDYPRQFHVGGGIATRLEPIGIKLEAGYKPLANTVLVQPGGGPLLGSTRDLAQLQVTGSLDYDRGDKLSVVLEGAHLRVFDVPSGAAVFQLDGDQLWMIASRVEWRPALPLAIRVLGFVDVSSPSYAVAPAVRYQGTDHVGIEIGFSLYGGTAGSLGGLGEHNDELVFTVQYSL